MSHRLKLLVVTGGHPFEMAPFLDVFATMDGVEWRHEQPPEVREWFHPKHAGEWDAIVCYDMQGIEFHKPDPPHLLAPPAEYAEGLLGMLDRGQGIVFLHHAMSAWPTWPAWADIVGGRWHYVPGELRGQQWPASGYTKETVHHVSVIDPAHPVCAGLGDGFDIEDEIYLNPVFQDDVVPLLRTDYPMTYEHFYSGELAILGQMYDRTGWKHPQGSGLVGWAKSSGRSPIVYLQPGHGPSAYASPAYRRLVRNAIEWVASPEAHGWAVERGV